MSSKALLKRYKSLQCLHDIELLTLENFHNNEISSIKTRRSRHSESSIEISIINDSDSEMEASVDLGRGGEELDREMGDSGIGEKAFQDGDVLRGLEMKVDKLCDCFVEQNKLLVDLKQQMKSTSHTLERVASEHSQLASEIINIALAQRLQYLQLDTTEEPVAAGADDAAGTVNSRARALLDALEIKRDSSIDAIIKSALTEFLQSDALKDQVVSATLASIKHLIEGCFARDVTASYLPLLERSHRRLLRQVTKILEDTFREMEANAAYFSRSSYNTTRNMNTVLKRHQRLVEDSMASSAVDAQSLKKTLDNVLEKELKQWREKIIEILTEHNSSKGSVSTLSYVPSSPPQPAEPGRSAIDQLMSAAEINVQMREGDINGSFERALSGSDLSLVMAACRAADPALVFTSPCRLEQRVLLSLIQQLATDMVHDTQLKCRYLEDAMMHLDTDNPTTRSHAPIVVSQVRNQLMSFLSKFPSHMSSRRIQMIIMATNSLLKNEKEAKKPMRISATYDS